jgi:methyl-accepting chemotaxis protein
MSKFLHNIPLVFKIALAPALVALCLCAVTGASWWNSSHTRAAVQHLVEHHLPYIARTGAINERVANLNGMVMQSLAYEGVGLKAGTIAALDQQILTEFDALAKDLAGLQATIDTDESGSIAQAKATITAFETFRARVKDTLDMKSMGLASAYGVMARSETSYAELRKSLAEMAKLDITAGSATATVAVQAAESTISTALALAALALVLFAAVTWWMSRAILGPLQRAVGVARTVASGDLRSRIEASGSDEIGQLMHALRDMNDSLASVVERVRDSSGSIATGSSQIATGNADLSQRTEEQASNLQQTAASMEQLSATVKNNADIARTAAQLATSASAVAVKGGDVVGQMVATMHDISASSAKITEIIGVIDGVAFQTNILALNAAVEAARAGEQGRGFAVVASEVRALAQRSAQAATEIKALIGASSEKVANGSRLVGQAGTTMTEIVAQARRVSDLIAEISAATAEQTSGIGQVSDAVSQLDQVTQHNAALVEESAAAADSLQQQAQRLVQAVGVFKLAGSASA